MMVGYRRGASWRDLTRTLLDRPALAGAGTAGEAASLRVTPSASGGDMASSARVERLISRMVTASRLGALGVLAATATLGGLTGLTGHGLAGLCVLAIVDSVALAAVAVRSPRGWCHWALVDAGCLLAVTVLPVLPELRTGVPAQSPFFVYVLVAVAALGLADWPLAVAASGAVLIGAGSLVAALLPDSAYPLSNAIPDSVTPLAVTVVVWLVGHGMRSAAASLDRQHAEALRRNRELAIARERARQQRVLGGELLATLAALAADRAIADPLLQEQVRVESRWLDMVVRTGLPEPPGSLIAALRRLIAEKTTAGMSIDFESDPTELSLGAAVVAALVEASREALTNVTKHAGTASASIRVTAVDGGVTVEIRDAGRGYDAAATAAGTGQSRSIRERLAGVGGQVEIDSVPGRGTTVRLRVPEQAMERGPR
jgi:signal transduction histidine kinase